MSKLMKNIAKGDTVTYMTTKIITQDRTIPSVTKTGIVEEVISACFGTAKFYWIKDEVELISEDQIIKKVVCEV